MDDTGEKVLYLCLEKAVDMEALAENTMPADWEGVLEGEEPLNLYYPDKDKVRCRVVCLSRVLSPFCAWCVTWVPRTRLHPSVLTEMIQ